jgi:hypothetical protein
MHGLGRQQVGQVELVSRLLYRWDWRPFRINVVLEIRGHFRPLECWTWPVTVETKVVSFAEPFCLRQAFPNRSRQATIPPPSDGAQPYGRWPHNLASRVPRLMF